MPNRPGYYAEWYEQNKEKLAEKRKKRYEEDPEYKQKVLDQSASYREKNRKEPRVKLPRHRKPKSYTLSDGTEIQMFSVGAFAMYIGRSVQSVNHWEREGLLPKTPYRRGARGFRLYSVPMMEVVKEVVGDRARLFPVDPEMGNKIRQKWEAAGVPVECKDGLEAALKLTTTS